MSKDKKLPGSMVQRSIYDSLLSKFNQCGNYFLGLILILIISEGFYHSQLPEVKSIREAERQYAEQYKKEFLNTFLESIDSKSDDFLTMSRKVSKNSFALDASGIAAFISDFMAKGKGTEDLKS